MPRIDALLAEGPTTSFEFFPPRTDAGEATLRATLGELECLTPSFVSITYGAGGSTRQRTHDLVVDLLTRTPMTPMAHLTTVSHTRDDVAAILRRYIDAGVENIMALRGDAPNGDETAFHAFAHATDLVELARQLGGDRLAIGVAAHPEGHPASPDLATDRRHLAAKLRVADFGVTQFFFEAEVYLRMMDDLAALGCDTPVIPGVMPVTDVKQIERFAALSGAAFPGWLAERLHAAADADEVRRIGVDVATELCDELLEAGAPGLHFYTLNRSTATRQIHARLTGARGAPA